MRSIAARSTSWVSVILLPFIGDSAPGIRAFDVQAPGEKKVLENLILVVTDDLRPR